MARQRSVHGVKVIALLAGIAICAWFLVGSTACAQFSGRGGGGKRGGGGGHQASESSDSRRGSTPTPQAILTPHGGECLSTETNYYEIVYLPLQVRIYLFDKNMKPLSARDVHARMSLQAPVESPVRHIPFQYVALPAGVAEQDYVVALLDMRELSEKETPITFEFSGLADRRQSTASFVPLFSAAKIRPYVAQVRLTEADRDSVPRQRICPVTGVALGSGGPVVKLYIADYPLYVAGEDCIAAVREAPERFLPQSSASAAGR